MVPTIHSSAPPLLLFLESLNVHILNRGERVYILMHMHVMPEMSRVSPHMTGANAPVTWSTNCFAFGFFRACLDLHKLSAGNLF